MATPRRHTAYTIATAAAIVAVAVAMAYLWQFDPVASPAPKCAFRALTGYDCPGCGSQRALHALLHGDAATAWSYNPFIFFAVPVAAVMGVVEIRRRQWPETHRILFSPVVIAIIAASIITWWIARNI